MLVPAVLYADEIKKAFGKYYYTEDMLLETGSIVDNWVPNLSDSGPEGYEAWAIVDNNENLKGFLCYTIDWYLSNVSRFGLISFDRGNLIIGKDLFNKLEELCEKFHRVEWRMVGGNPVEKHYDKFIERHNGHKIVLPDAIKDRDGNYRSDNIYYILNPNK